MRAAGLAVGVMLLALGALAIRVPQLDVRPVHTDEAVHSIKFKGLWDEGRYRYDPDEYHGPTLYYTTLAVAWASEARRFAELNESTLRLVPVLFGVGLVLLLGWVRDGQGAGGILWAGLLTAVSPAMVFYSRYYIHEMLLVFFTFLFMVAAWRYLRSGGLGWCLLAGAALGLMHATKETFVFALAAMAGAVVLTRFWNHGVLRERMPDRDGELGAGDGRQGFCQRWLGCRAADWARLRWGHLAAGAAVALVVSVVLFSSFFTNASGPLDSVRTYLPWLDRARGASPHIHPWHYFVNLLAYNKVGRGPVWSEALIMGLALVGLGAAIGRRTWTGVNLDWARFIGFYSVLLLGIYSVIPYKTPWCLAGFWHGFILMAGLGAVALVSWARWLPVQAIVAALLLAGSAQLGVQAYRAAIPYADSQRNPYVYAQTLESTLNLVDRVQGLARAHPDGHDMLIQVMARGGDYWPLPWYFRQFTRTGWWAQVPANPVAPVVIASPAFEAELTERLGATHQMAGYFGLRPAVFLMLFVERDTWRAYLDLDDDDD
jgi:uncharacterized protein (TIGR03663 family)